MRLVGPVRWSGWGIISPKGLCLEAVKERSSYIVEKLEGRPRGSRLVRVQATLTPVTRTLKTRKRPSLAK